VHSAQILPDSFWARANFNRVPAFAPLHSAKAKKYLARIPGVYPYSVVPGGIKDPGDLRAIAARDYVVRRHFSHFDYNHAQLIHAAEAREVYLSYRIRDTIFWTRRKIRLHLGELLLTDGKITARARCGNQISDVAKPEVSDEEPDQDVLDQPVAELGSPSSPVRPMLAPPDLPSGMPSPPQLFAGGFIFPYVSVGLPLPGRLCPPNDATVDGHCVPKRKKPVVPEPSTIVLLGSGMVFTLWRYRRIARPVAA
jgi:hypothetical protein